MYGTLFKNMVQTFDFLCPSSSMDLRRCLEVPEADLMTSFQHENPQYMIQTTNSKNQSLINESGVHYGKTFSSPSVFRNYLKLTSLLASYSLSILFTCLE